MSEVLNHEENNLCFTGNHGKDYDQSVSPYSPTAQPAAWSKLGSSDFFNPTSTPDNYSYYSSPMTTSGPSWSRLVLGAFRKVN